MNIAEQVIDDTVMNGLTIEFKECGPGKAMLIIKGQGLRHGNRDFFFSEDGICDGRGTMFPVEEACDG